jgi:poly [ADP-ribose] polymerase
MTPVSTELQLLQNFNSKIIQKVNKGYTKIEITYESEDIKPKKAKGKNKKNDKKSKLVPEVQELLKFIFDMKQIEKSIVKVGYNVKKLPLGKLSKQTIKNGYLVLKKIDEALKAKKPDKNKLSELSSEFYRYIPHDFKFEKMSKFILDTKEKLKDKLTLVETLADIQITAEITNEAEDQEDLNELDAKYKKLNCSIDPLDKNSKEYKTLLKAAVIDHQSTRSPSINVLDIFKINRSSEPKKFKKDIGNRKLLWHGSTFSNWGGILSQGLRIAPPEAPACGYAFGKGVYFADVLNKSSGYTRYHSSNNIGLLTLADVALGKTNDVTNCDSSITLSNLPKGTRSTHGLGRLEPNGKVKWEGSELQTGPIKSSTKGWLGFSEFIIYDVDQIQMKYLFKVKFG